jgi:hypothetical protein
MKSMIVMAVAAFAAVVQAGDAPKAIPVYKTYKLRTGQVLSLSESQSAIANKDWHVVDPEVIADAASKVTVTINVDKNDGTHMLGTGFFINSSEI